MSGSINSESEVLTKLWSDYSSNEIRRHCLRNLKNYDCSFKSEDQKKKKVHKSFKWILCEISPVLKEILDDEENQAKNCREIIVSNPKYIEAILFYGHTKIVDTEIINLVDLYEASKKYQIKALEDEVIHMFESGENQMNANWIKLFWLFYVKYPKDQQMRHVFEKILVHVNGNDALAEANIDLIQEFDEENFDIFFDIMMGRLKRLKCFEITEVYLIKHLLDGNKKKRLEEINPSERNLVRLYMNKMNLGNYLEWNEYKNGPLVSKLLTRKHKIEHLEEIKMRCDRFLYNRNLSDLELCLKKMRKRESNLKTFNNFKKQVSQCYFLKKYNQMMLRK